MISSIGITKALNSNNVRYLYYICSEIFSATHLQVLTNSHILQLRFHFSKRSIFKFYCIVMLGWFFPEAWTIFFRFKTKFCCSFGEILKANDSCAGRFWCRICCWCAGFEFNYIEAYRYCKLPVKITGCLKV